MFVRFILFLGVILSVLSCESDRSARSDNNPFLVESSPNFSLDLNSITNAVLLEINGIRFLPTNIAVGSIDGVYIRNAGNGQYDAFELAEPNTTRGTCSIPPKLEGLYIEYTCGDEKSFYNFVDGTKKGEESTAFPLRRYSVRLVDNGLFITR